jgi:tetratricopeptide (TPR) repeat protein
MKPSCETYQDQFVAWLEGSLDREAQEQLMRHVTDCPECREEVAWMKELGGELESIGDDIAAAMPEIDLVAAVMAEVSGQAEPAPKVVVLDDYRKPRIWVAAGSMLAAAAAFLVVFWVAGGRDYVVPQTTPMAQVSPGLPPTHGPAAQSQTSAVQSEAQTQETQTPAVETQEPQTDTQAPEFAQTEAPELKTLTLAQITADTRNAANPRAAAARFATLDADTARKVATAADATPEAIVGAAASMDPAEARIYLAKVVEQDPTNPYYRMQLAMASGSEGMVSDTDLAAVTDLDPENALPHYQLASNAFKKGDASNGFAYLGEAGGLKSATAYSRTAAACREKALEKSGAEQSAAQVAAAANMGSEEYRQISQLAQSLLEQARAYESQGDYESAQKLYDAVDGLGSQLAAGAESSGEEMAGLEAQRGATDGLQAMYQQLGNVQDEDGASKRAAALTAAVQTLTTFLGEVNETFFDDTPGAAANTAGQILANGDRPASK